MQAEAQVQDRYRIHIVIDRRCSRSLVAADQALDTFSLNACHRGLIAAYVLPPTFDIGCLIVHYALCRLKWQVNPTSHQYSPAWVGPHSRQPHLISRLKTFIAGPRQGQGGRPQYPVSIAPQNHSYPPQHMPPPESAQPQAPYHNAPYHAPPPPIPQPNGSGMINLMGESVIKSLRSDL